MYSLSRGGLVTLLVALAVNGCCRSGASAERAGAGGSTAAKQPSPGLTLPAILGGPKEHGAPQSYAAPAFTAGSFSRLRLTKNGQPDGEQTIKVLGVTGDQIRVEIEATYPKTGTTIVGALLRVRDRRLPSGLDILEATLKRGGGAPLKLSGPQLKASQALLGNQFDVFAFPDAAQLPKREDVTVPAGTFKACLVVEREGTVTLPLLGKRKTKIKSFYHPAVTTNGIVKQESTTDGEMQLSELVEMGSSGATSSLLPMRPRRSSPRAGSLARRIAPGRGTFSSARPLPAGDASGRT